MSNRSLQPDPVLDHRPTLALAAHGSSDDPRCAAPVYRHAQAIEKLGLFREVHCIFWKQTPRFRDLQAIASPGLIVVVPLMTADGYYARTVLPRELGRGSASSELNARIARPIGTMHALADLIAAQAREAALTQGVDLAQSALLIVGHGTWREPHRSGDSTWRCARHLSHRGVAASVHVAFLEQLPSIAAVVEGIEGRRPIVVVPNLIANGGHAQGDIPQALGCPAGTTVANLRGRKVIFADAVGERDECVGLIVEAALEALAPSESGMRATA